MRPTNSDTKYDKMDELVYTMMIMNISALAVAWDFLHWLRDYLWLKKTEATFYVGGGAIREADLLMICLLPYLPRQKCQNFMRGDPYKLGQTPLDH